MTIETMPFDPAEFIDTPEAQAELLDEAMASADPAFIAAALGVIARARGLATTLRTMMVRNATRSWLAELVDDLDECHQRYLGHILLYL